MGTNEYEWEISVPAKNGIPIPPRFIECPECGEEVRRRPGHVYSCSCGAVTTLIVPKTKR